MNFELIDRAVEAALNKLGSDFDTSVSPYPHRGDPLHYDTTLHDTQDVRKELRAALAELKEEDVASPQRDVISEAMLPPGTWISMSYKRRSENRWEWLGKIQNDKRSAPAGKLLYRESPVELVCELPAMFIERYGKEFGIV